MSDSQAILPITASADGRLNMYFSRCEVAGQMMNYAACLWRQEVLEKPGIKTPADWAGCSEAAKCGKCPASEMRREEVLQGRAIYFRARSTGLTIKQEAMKLYETEFGKPVSSITPPSTGVMFLGGSRKSTSAPPVIAKATAHVASKPKHVGSLLDAMGEVDDYAAAINAAVVADAHITPVETKPAPQTSTLPSTPAPKAPMVTALPGESPLAMARRLAAQRAATA